VHLSDAEFVLRHAPPALGEDGEAILTEHGFSAAEIAAFKREGVVG
jgi:crotonobetainyl-CoA:carnitine CoA-transferase CaiB-like acyl-CoA transferase